MSTKKPSLHLLSGDSPELKDVIAMFKSLTGREPTEAEIEAAKRELEASDDE